MSTKIPPSSREAEESLLGCLLIGSKYIEEAMGIVPPDMFYYADTQKIMVAMVTLWQKQVPVDIITVTNELRRMGEPSGIALRITDLSSVVVSDINAHSYAQIIIEKFILRESIRRSIEIQDLAEMEDLGSVMIQAGEMAEALLKPIPSRRTSILMDLFSESVKEMDARAAGSSNVVHIDFGMSCMDRVIGGLEPGNLMILAARPSMGKAQGLDAKVLTPNGWTTMGELSVGQAVASIDGGESVITGIFPQGKLQLWQVTFSDGRTAECSVDHLWSVMFRHWDAPRVLPLSRIIEMLKCRRYKDRIWIEAPSGDYGSDQELLIDPWVLGVLIGDGCLIASTPRISNPSEELLDNLRGKLALTHELREEKSCDYRIVAINNPDHKNPLTESLRELGLMGKHSYDKYIPAQYLMSSRKSRVELFGGLMDTDGYIDANGSMSYSTSSKQLADDIIELVRSLGGWCHYTTKKPSYTYKGEKLEGRLSYTCRIGNMGKEDICVVPFKRNRIKDIPAQRRITFTNVEPTQIAEAQCISVSHPSQLYVTDNYVVTHNTALALQMAYNISQVYPVLYLTLEMTNMEIVNRYLTMLTEIDSVRLRRAKNLSSDEWSLIEHAGRDIETRKLHIDDSPGVSIYNIRSKIYRMIQKFGVKLVIIDYLQLMVGAKGKEGSEYYGSISHTCKNVAKELNIPIIMLSQLNREVEKGADKIPRLHHLRESGDIEQDADIVIFPVRCERAGIVGQSAGWDSDAAVMSIAKNRNGAIANVVVKVSSNASKWWDSNDVFTGPHQAPAPTFQIDG